MSVVAKKQETPSVRDKFEESVSASIVNERIQNVGPYLKAHIALWSIVSVYLFIRGGMPAAASCAALSAAVVGLLHYYSNRASMSKQLLVNLFLGIMAVSLLLVGIFSDRVQSTVAFQYPLLCLIAAQLLGMRAAMSWFFLSILAIYFSVVPPWLGGQATKQDFDVLCGSIALALSMLWICDRAERFFVKRTAYLQRLTDSLTEKSRLLGLAEETAKVGHWLWNHRTGKTHISEVLRDMCGLDAESEFKIVELTHCFSQSSAESFQDTLVTASRTGDPFSLELTISKPDGGVRHFTCHGNCQVNEKDEVQSIFGVIRDETALKEVTQRLSRKADELNRLATVDTLTGLTNRLQFRRLLNESVTNASKNSKLMALLVLDMDGFKEINDTLGHATGDLVLREASDRISSIVRGNDVVSRLGGDEFTVILNSVSSVEMVADISKRIVAEIRKPMVFENTKLEVGASVGASFCPHDSISADELFTFADTAMYEAKFNGLDFSLYQTWMTDDLVKRKRVESKLAGALDRDEFSVVYQPQYRVGDNKIIGFEALMRWNRDGSVVAPSEFIPLLESSGKIIEVGQWILEQSCKQVERWAKKGFDIRVAVNISPVQFRDSMFYERVTETISRYDISPSLIDLEITEGVIIHDIERTSEVLSRLSEYGCMISVDDFGTGYSSLAYLKKFPIDRLKIDRVFIKDFPGHDDGMIAASIIVLGLSLGMEVLAEGVETDAQLEFLRHQDCLMFQGNLRSVPISPEKCLALLEENKQQRTDATATSLIRS